MTCKTIPLAITHVSWEAYKKFLGHDPRKNVDPNVIDAFIKTLPASSKDMYSHWYRHFTVIFGVEIDQRIMKKLVWIEGVDISYFTDIHEPIQKGLFTGSFRAWYFFIVNTLTQSNQIETLLLASKLYESFQPTPFIRYFLDEYTWETTQEGIIKLRPR
jgi:hypothetical protein